MRKLVVPALAAFLMAFLSGCVVEVDGESSTTKHNGTSTTCINDRCTTCSDGDCSTEGPAPRPAGPFKDITIQETHDLTGGLGETTYTFQANTGATGHIRLILRDVVTGQASIVPSLCYDYVVVNDDPANGTSSRQSGGQGSCGGSNGVSLSLNGLDALEPRTVLDWTPSRAHYTLTVSADAQPNELVVDVVIDNP